MKRQFIVLMLVLIAACDKKRGMETRTFELSRLSSDQALALLTPYIHDGGYLSGKDRLITVRDKPERLKLIDDLLKKYDGGGQAVDVALHLQVVQADGFNTQDSALTDIEPVLRQTFRYHGYKLVGETQVRVREEGAFEQTVGAYSVQGRVHRMEPGAEKRLPMEIQLHAAPKQTPQGWVAQEGMATTVTTTMGKPMVLGQSTGNGAIILVIRPSLAPM